MRRKQSTINLQAYFYYNLLLSYNARQYSFRYLHYTLIFCRCFTIRIIISSIFFETPFSCISTSSSHSQKTLVWLGFITLKVKASDITLRRQMWCLLSCFFIKYRKFEPPREFRGLRAQVYKKGLRL